MLLFSRFISMSLATATCFFTLSSSACLSAAQSKRPLGTATRGGYAVYDNSVTPSAQPLRPSVLHGGVDLQDSAAASATESIPAIAPVTLPNSATSQSPFPNDTSQFRLLQPTAELASPPAPSQRYTLSETQQATRDRFRHMQYGVLGMYAAKNLTGPSYIIIQLHEGCPALEAGLQLGDEELQINDHIFSEADTSTDYWQASAGRAGSAVTLIVRRQHQILTFHFKRINIEDIKNDEVRHIYEEELARVGPPTK